MAIKPQDKARILAEAGVDPTKYWIDDNGEIIDMPEQGTVETALKSTLHNAPRTALGFVGSAVGAAGAGALATPETAGLATIPAALAGGAAGGLAGGAAGQSLQDWLYPESWKLAEEARMARSPITTKVADIGASMALMRPSATVFKAAARAPGEFLRTAGQLQPKTVEALANIGLGAGMSGGMAAAQGASPGEIALETALGATQVQPTWLGTKLSGGLFKPFTTEGLAQPGGLPTAEAQARFAAALEAQNAPSQPTVAPEALAELAKKAAKQQAADAKRVQEGAIAAEGARQNEIQRLRQAEVEAAMTPGQGAPVAGSLYPFGGERPIGQTVQRGRRAAAPEVEPAVLPGDTRTIDERLAATGGAPEQQMKLTPAAEQAEEARLRGASPVEQELAMLLSPEQHKYFRDVFAKYDTEYQDVPELDASGRFVPRKSAAEPSRTDISSRAYLDVYPHEALHALLSDTLNYGTARERAFTERALRELGIEVLTDANGRKSLAEGGEEALAKQVGEESIRVLAGKQKPAPVREAFSDFVDYLINDKLTPDVARRILRDRTVFGAGTRGIVARAARRGGATAAAGAPPVTPEAAEQQQPAAQAPAPRPFEPVELPERLAPTRDMTPEQIAQVEAAREAARTPPPPAAEAEAAQAQRRADELAARAEQMRTLLDEQEARLRRLESAERTRQRISALPESPLGLQRRAAREEARTARLTEFEQTRPSMREEEGAGLLTQEERDYVDAQRYADTGGEIPMSPEAIGEDFLPPTLRALPAEDPRVREARQRAFENAQDELENPPAPRPPGSVRLGAERAARRAERESAAAMQAAREAAARGERIGPGTKVTRPESIENIGTGQAYMANQAKRMRTSARETPDDLEARRIEERLSGRDRGRDRYQPLDPRRITEMVSESVSDNVGDIVKRIDSAYESILNSTGKMPHMASTLGSYIRSVVLEKPSSFAYLNYKVGDKTFPNLSGKLFDYAAITNKPIEYSDAAIAGYKAMANGVVNVLNNFKIPRDKVENIKGLLDVLANQKLMHSAELENLNDYVKKHYTFDRLDYRYADAVRINAQIEAARLFKVTEQIYGNAIDGSEPIKRDEFGELIPLRRRFLPNESQRPRYQPLAEDRPVFATQFQKELDSPNPLGAMPGKDGRIPANNLRTGLARLNTVERELLKNAGLDAFLRNIPRPTVAELKSWANARLPKIEIRPQLAISADFKADERELAILNHDWYENLNIDRRRLVNEAYETGNVDNPEILANFTQEERAKMDRFFELNRELARQNNLRKDVPDSATARYTNVNPRRLEDMPGAVDILVKMPGSGQDFAVDKGHYPREGKDLVTHVRAYEHTLPDGTKALRVFELQSDWGQERRKWEKELKTTWPAIESLDKLPDGWYIQRDANEILLRNPYGYPIALATNEQELLSNYQANRRVVDADVPDSPILSQTDSLGLKAAVEYARERGISKLIIDDVQTAMMTEGHDKNRRILNTPENIKKLKDAGHDNVAYQLARDTPIDFNDFGNSGAKALAKLKLEVGIPQLKGMTRAYNDILPQLMRKMTGDKGTPVNMGEHWRASADGRTRDMLVFKNPDGSPKTESTGIMYDLGVPQARRTAGEPFSLSGERYQPLQSNRDQINSPEFKRWFGNSVVKDKDGKPLIVYHGSTNTDFTVFDPELSRYNKAIFFTPDYEVAKKFANKWGGNEREPRKFYLKLENPLYDTLGVREGRDGTGYAQAEEALTKGHDGFILSPIGERIGGKLIYAKQYAVFDPRQIKSADSNVGTFDPSNPDIRYQPLGPERGEYKGAKLPERERRVFVRGIFAGNVEALRRTGDPQKVEFAGAMEELYARIRNYTGQYEEGIIRPLTELSKASQQKVVEALYDESMTRQPATAGLSPDELAAHREIRAGLLKMRDDQIAANHLIEGKPAGRDRFYFPHVVDSSIIHDLSNTPESPRAKEAERQFIDFNAELFRNKGIAPAVAQRMATDAFGKFIGSLKPISVDSGFDYGAVSMPAGTKLPPTWVAADPIDGFRSYIKRFSRARAFYDVIGRDENAMRQIGRKFYYDAAGKEAAVTNPGSRLQRDPNVRALLENALGITHESQEGITPAIGRLANSLLLGNVATRLTDAATTPFKALAYLPPRYIPGLLTNMRNLRSSIDNAYKTGGVRRGDMMVVREVLGAGDRYVKGMDKIAETITKYTGSEALEKGARFLAQNVGEYIYDVNKMLADRGDKRAADFMNRVTPKWRTLAREETAQRIARLFQGNYDATNLPIWIANSPAAPFFSMMKWNIEQWNNFKRFAWEPALKGDPYALMATVLGGVAGGIAVGELREKITGKKQRVATAGELNFGFREGDKARASMEAMRKAAFLSQVTGTFGIVGELSLQAIDVASKDKPQGFSWPAYEFVSNVIGKIANAVPAAIERPEDALLITGTAANDLAKDIMAQYRILWNAADRAKGAGEVEEANRRRDLRMSEKLRGEPTRFSPFIERDYRNERERQFDKAHDRQQAIEIAKQLDARARRESATGAEYKEARRKLRTSRIVGIPSRENNPQQFYRHLQFVRDTQGAEAADRLARDYVMLRTEQKWKSSMFR